MLNSIVRACLASGAYTLSSGTMEPAVVLRRLLDALLIVDPDAHRKLTTEGSSYSVVPNAALHDELHRWWGSEEALLLVESIIGAIDNATARHGFICSFQGSDHFLLERVDNPLPLGSAGATIPPPTTHHPPPTTHHPPPSISVLRARVRPNEC
jgi:hypothetical protein